MILLTLVVLLKQTVPQVKALYLIPTMPALKMEKSSVSLPATVTLTKLQ